MLIYTNIMFIFVGIIQQYKIMTTTLALEKVLVWEEISTPYGEPVIGFELFNDETVSQYLIRECDFADWVEETYDFDSISFNYRTQDIEHHAAGGYYENADDYKNLENFEKCYSQSPELFKIKTFKNV